MLIIGIHVQRGRYLRMLHGQQYLDQSTHPRGGDHMPHVGFHRSQSAISPLIRVFPE